MWMDADNRTAAIGTPGGSFGWIMDRKATGGDDRIQAAREIMEWQGYDMSLTRE
jgi:apolipoprotein D and lipocalin family protein